MILKSPLSAKQISIIAIGALDDLVNDLLKASCLRIKPAFLDWIADEATPLIDQYVALSINNSRFVDSLRIGDPVIAMARWVRHWVCPWIGENFGELAGYLPEFIDKPRRKHAAQGSEPSRIFRPKVLAPTKNLSGARQTLPSMAGSRARTATPPLFWS